jgi:hypothetical protein
VLCVYGPVPCEELGRKQILGAGCYIWYSVDEPLLQMRVLHGTLPVEMYNAHSYMAEER